MMEVALSKGAVALIDDADASLVHGYAWYLLQTKGRKYAACRVCENGAKRTVFMHRLITSAPRGLEVDHIDSNGLDNRRSNLRVCTHAENQRNRRRNATTTSSRFKGVVREKRTQKWCAGIKTDGRRIHLGTFVHEIDAAIAYNVAALEMFGEYAALNEVQCRGST